MPAIDWAPFVELVRQPRRVLMTTHIRPDGDALGSMLALGLALEKQGKAVDMVVASTIPPRYDFLDLGRRVKRFEAPGDGYRRAEAVVVLDTGTWNQLGDFAALMRQLDVPKAVIDHHQTQDDLSARRFVDTAAEAAGRLAYEAIVALGVPLDAEMAHCLFVALAMDTGWFRHANTRPETFALAATLQAAGARPTEAYEMLFEQSSLGRLKLTGVVLGRLQLAHQGRTCFTELHKDDYTLTGATPQDSEDLVNYTRSVTGAEVGVLFLEQPKGGVKVSLRARRIDVARVAEQFGGGGHKLAAGAVLDLPLADARSRVLSAVGTALAEPA